MSAKSMDGTEYSVPSWMGQIDDVIVGNPGHLDQLITTSKSLDKRLLWADSLRFSKDVAMHVLERPEWRIQRIEAQGEGLQVLHFIPVFKKKNDKGIDAVKFAELVKELGLTDEKLRTLLRSMLLMLFRPETLRKLEASEKLEFIMDSHWIYLKDGNTVYRV